MLRVILVACLASCPMTVAIHLRTKFTISELMLLCAICCCANAVVTRTILGL